MKTLAEAVSHAADLSQLIGVVVSAQPKRESHYG